VTWKASNFSKYCIRVTLEGNDPERFLDKCIREGIALKNIVRKNDCTITFEILSSDYRKITEMAGNRYKLRISREKGLFYRIRLMLNRKILLAGLMLFSGIIYYQSLFISEISVNGYESISEQALRQSMESAGFYEGCRKSVNLNKVKLQIYDDFDNISWVGIQYDGNLARVNIAEGGEPYINDAVADDSPCNIVADKDGYIDDVIPREGVRAVEDGHFVREGDVLISGIIPLESTAYGKEDEKKTEMYVHAQGTVTARIPVRLDFYMEACETEFKSESRRLWLLCVNGKNPVLDLIPYEKARVERVDIINAVKPFRLKIQLVSIEKINLSRTEITDKKAKEKVLNETHKYIKENLPEDTQILNKSLNFTREKNIIKAGVTLETLQQIGKEEEIIIDNSNGKSEKNDDQ